MGADRKAEWAALAVAVAAHPALLPEEIEAGYYLELFRSALRDDLNQAGRLVELLRDAAASAAREERTLEFAASRGLRRGVSGYA